MKFCRMQQERRDGVPRGLEDGRRKPPAKEVGSSAKVVPKFAVPYLKVAQDKLKPKYRKNPYSIESIDALEEKYRGLFDGRYHGVIASAILEDVLSAADREVLKRISQKT
jgi:hypothetical protein